jgi:hypothetical protein
MLWRSVGKLATWVRILVVYTHSAMSILGKDIYAKYKSTPHFISSSINNVQLTYPLQQQSLAVADRSDKRCKKRAESPCSCDVWA